MVDIYTLKAFLRGQLPPGISFTKNALLIIESNKIRNLFQKYEEIFIQAEEKIIAITEPRRVRQVIVSNIPKKGRKIVQE